MRKNEKMEYTPRVIYNWLCEFVKGQEVPLHKITTSLSIHINAVLNMNDTISRSNILIVGPTGSGKTETIRGLKELYLPFPIVKINALDYSVGAWQGRDITDVFTTAYKESVKMIREDLNKTASESEIRSMALESTSHSIIVIDEFDKLAKREENSSSNAFLAEYQYKLLGLLEGAEVPVKIIEAVGDTPAMIYRISTLNVLYVLMGAFDGLEEITKKRVSPPAPIGFQSSAAGEQKLDLTPNTDDLIAYGFSRELVGRIPIRAKYNKLSADLLVDIMKNAANSPLKKMQDRAKLLGCDLIFEDEALEAISKIALSMNTGARGIDSILCELVYDELFNSCDGREWTLKFNKHAAEKRCCPLRARKLRKVIGD